MLKKDYPFAITELLGIPAQQGIAGPWMSNQGTVIQPWLEAVGEALNVPYTGNKTTMMQALVEAVGGVWDPYTMASTETPSKGGGNISKPAFQALFEALTVEVITTPVATINEDAGPFLPADPPDRANDERMLRAIRIRRGQPKFRSDLLVAYSGRCAVTACDVTEVLEAAHVVPYGDGGTYAPTNGLLLRADVHTLFDSQKLCFDVDRRVVVHPSIAVTDYGAGLDGSKLSEPIDPSLRVPNEALSWHRALCGF